MFWELKKKLKNSVKKQTLIKFIGFLLLWEMTVRVLAIPIYLLPAPSQILAAMLQSYQLLLYHSFFTISEALIGIILAIIIGITLAIAMDYYPKFNQFIKPFITINQTIPTIVLAPLFVIWFGFGMSSKIYLVASMGSFPILINTLNGLESVNSDQIKLFKLMNASTIDTYWHLKLPTSLAALFAGIRITITYAFTTALLAEFMGAKNGLGIYLSRSLTSFNTPIVFAIVVIIVIVTLLMVEILNQIEKKLIKGG